MNSLIHPTSLIQQTEFSGPVSLDKGSSVDRSKLAPYVSIGCYSYITRTSVSSFVSIGSRVSVGGYNHQFSERFSSFGLRSFESHLTSGSSSRQSIIHTNIMPDVWIADNAIVLSGVTLAVGSVVGAGAVVTKSTEPYGIYVGNPARLLKLRFTLDIVNKLVNTSWWSSPDLLLMTKYIDEPVCKFLDQFP